MTSDQTVKLLFSHEEHWTELGRPHEEKVAILKAIDPAWLTTRNLMRALPKDISNEHGYVAHAFAAEGMLHLIPLEQITEELLHLEETYSEKSVLTHALEADPATVPREFINFKNLTKPTDQFVPLFSSQRIRDLPITPDLVAHFDEINTIVKKYTELSRRRTAHDEDEAKRREEGIQAARLFIVRIARTALEPARTLTPRH